MMVGHSCGAMVCRGAMGKWFDGDAYRWFWAVKIPHKMSHFSLGGRYCLVGNTSLKKCPLTPPHPPHLIANS